MTSNAITNDLLSARTTGTKRLAVLIDPDASNLQHFDQIMTLAEGQGVDYIFVGGSLLINDELDRCIQTIKKSYDLPVVLFPGNNLQISSHADAILFMSLISGRNPEYLIGQQVAAAPYIRQAKLEAVSTGYMLIDGGRPSTAQHISHTFPIPSDKNDVAVATAMAAEMMGMSILYMDAGSGAQKPVSEEMIAAVTEKVNCPLIVGGGLRTAESVYSRARAGADVIVVGNAIEKDPSLILEMAQALREAALTV